MSGHGNNGPTFYEGADHGDAHGYILRDDKGVLKSMSLIRFSHLM